MMIKRLAHYLSRAACVCLLSTATWSVAATQDSDQQEQQRFEAYVAALKVEALDKGFRQDIIDTAFVNLKLRKKVVKADRSQPEFVETLETYLPKRVSEWKIKKARKLFKKHHALLTQVGDEYGVQPRFIVSLWGLETNFGSFQGGHSVIASLVTLSFDGRREAFFKKELWAALDIIQNQGVSIDKFKGSWAGAMGQTQFMPTSYQAYAVDYDKDGVKDIWNNHADVFASAANYLKTRGWNDELTWGRQVKLPDGFNFAHVVPKSTKGRSDWLNKWADTERSLAEWQKLGVRKMDGKDLPNAAISAAIMIPDGEKGRAYLAYDNYKVLMHWNRSYYFVSTVGYLADRIAYPAIK